MLNFRPIKRLLFITAAAAAALAAGCSNSGGGGGGKSPSTPVAWRDVPAVRLSYRYEADVPPPQIEPRTAEDRNPAVSADFDNGRTLEILDRTITSPNKKAVLAVYHRAGDKESEFRLDMYTPDGKLLRKVSSDAMAIHFPDTITWSPDSSAVAFVAMTRAAIPDGGIVPAAGAAPPDAADGTDAAPQAAPTPAAPTGILTFRSEQIYIANADGQGVKPLTQNEGLIYFHYVWSPDSSMLAALAMTVREWDLYDGIAATKGEFWYPAGRLRVVEKNGRERRLDDNVTVVRPVFSPDSTKVAIAFDTQVRIYDVVGTAPTQASAPLRNQLLLSSQAYDNEKKRELESGSSNADTGSSPSPTPAPAAATLPDERTLVSFNPIVEVAWQQDDLIYLMTAYVKRMKNDADSVTSYARWHRLVLTPQASGPEKQN